MRDFQYADEKITSKELMIALPAVAIGAGILYLPRDIATLTNAADGWVSILLSGLFTVIMAWLIAKIASRFPSQSFLELASAIATRPIAYILTAIYSLIGLNLAALQLTSMANVSQKYLFENTPYEVIALAFFLVVIYAVSGSRAGLFRLNMLFIPFIIVITVLVLILSLGDADIGNVLPVFQTDWSAYVQGSVNGFTIYIGFAILWFYTSLVRDPENVPRRAAIGMSIPLAIYLLLFIATLAVFGNDVTQNLLYPTVELAKTVEFPFLERFEMVFFVIWMMAIFNAIAIFLDISIMLLQMIFTKTSKLRIIYVVAPIAYFIAMVPENIVEDRIYAKWVSYISVPFSIFVLVVLFILMKIRKVKPNDRSDR